MQRLTSAGYNAPVPLDREEAARAAAIASMAFRLAAAGPRTRQRLVDREVVQEPPPADRLAGPPQDGAAVEIAQRLETRTLSYVPFHEPALSMAPVPRSPAATLRLVAGLGTASACGFGLVLLLQGPLGKALHHTMEKVKTAPVEVAAATVATDLPAATVAPPPRVMEEATPEMPPPAKVLANASATPQPHTASPLVALGDGGVASVASVKPVFRAARAKPAPVLATPSPVRTRAITEYAAITRPRPRPQLLEAQAESKPRATHPASLARYDLPRWLTEDHPAKPRVLVMSEPPHDLMPPSDAQTPATAPPQPASAPPRPAPAMHSQTVMYAAPGSPNPVQLRPPGYRPFYNTYYGPYYLPSQTGNAARSYVASGTTSREYPQAPSNGW